MNENRNKNINDSNNKIINEMIHYDINYSEALHYINQLNSRGIALGLERIETLLNLLGNPQDRLQCIHVAGTKGKGSVCAFLDCALQKAGLQIGRYISPTLYEYRERIQINGTYISEPDFAALLTKVRHACEQMAQQGQEVPTVFEVETAVAFLYFVQQNCDYVLLEVGMGGRLDSTNVIAKPALAIITSISMDHTAMLGNTLAAIAAEKSGIIKEGCPAVIGIQQPEAMEVLLQRCAEYNVTPAIVNKTTLQRQQWTPQGQQFAYGRWQELSIGLLGDYQCENAAIALEALQFLQLQLLQKKENGLTDEAIRTGLAEAKWPGRFEVIHQNPLVIVDGAHNPAGAQALVTTLQKYFSERNIYLLMGVFRDKDYREIAQIMSACSDTIYCFRPQQERGLEAETLAEAVQPFYPNVFVVDSAEDALRRAMMQSEICDRENNMEYSMIVSFGSLSTIGDIQRAITQITQQQEVQHGTEQ